MRSRSQATALNLLARGAGNRTVSRVLARVKKYAGLYENPKYASTVYPAREGLLKRFVAIYRYLELKDAKADDIKQAWETVRGSMDAELKRLDALATPTAVDKAKKTELQQILKQSKLSADQMAYQTGEWEARLLNGDAAVWKEVQHHFGAGKVPDWLKPMVQNYTGMRYLSAHGSYASPRRLLYVLAYGQAETTAKAAAPKGQKPKIAVEKTVIEELKKLSDEDVLQRLRDMRTRNEIPDAAWREVVDLSELRLDAEGPAQSTGDEKAKLEGDWKTIINRWKDGGFSDPLTGEAGGRAWLAELKRSGAQTMLGVVCNQLAEASARQRGIKLTSGISQNEGDFYAASTAKQPATPDVKDGKQAVAAYFRHPTSQDDFRPAANLFFVHDQWADKDPGGHAVVRYRAGFDYPVAPTPEYIASWKAWKNDDDAYKKAKHDWDAKIKAAKTDAAKEKVGAEPVKPTSTEPEFKGVKTLPGNDETVEDWTYQVVEGQPITRTHSDGRKQWMQWLHQATVVQRVGSRVFTFETVDTATWGRGSGMGERNVNDLMNNPKVFIGWMPGNDPQYEVPATVTPAAPAATTTPPVSGPVCEPEQATPQAQSGPSCALPEPDQETEAERTARQLEPTR